MEQSPEKRKGHVTASVLLGGCLLECFIAADALACPPREIQGFTEEHYHASYELLLCQGGAGFQFANGTAYGYQADTVFLFPPHVRHASLLNRGQRERRTSIRFLVHPWDRARNGGAGDLEQALASLREAGCAHFPMDGRMTRLLDMLREDTPGRGSWRPGGCWRRCSAGCSRSCAAPSARAGPAPARCWTTPAGGNSWWTTTSTGWRTAGRSRDG